MPSIIAIKPYPACLGLATSHERFIAWGIELPYLNKCCIMGKPRVQLSMQISLFVEKGVQELAKRKNVQITPFSH